MTILKRTTVTETITVLFVILFLYTGLSKLMDYGIFKEQIATSPFLSPMAPLIATWLPWVEFLAVILLIVPRWRLKGFYFSLIMMILFTSYVIAILLFNKNIPCSCGGVIESLSWGGHVVFNSVFVVLGTLGILLERKNKQATYKALQSILS